MLLSDTLSRFHNLCFKDGEEEEKCYLTGILWKDRAVEGFILT